MCNCSKQIQDEDVAKLYNLILSLEEKIEILVEEMDYINRNTLSSNEGWE